MNDSSLPFALSFLNISILKHSQKPIYPRHQKYFFARFLVFRCHYPIVYTSTLYSVIPPLLRMKQIYSSTYYRIRLIYTPFTFYNKIHRFFSQFSFFVLYARKTLPQLFSFFFFPTFFLHHSITIPHFSSFI